MSGYQTLRRWQRIEEHANKLGFMIGNPKHGWSSDNGDSVAIFPKDDALPTFSRDAELFSGTFRELEIWLAGWERSQQYDMLLRMTDEKRRKKFEDALRERQRLEAERLEKRKMFAALADKTEEEVDKLMKVSKTKAEKLTGQTLKAPARVRPSLGPLLK